MTEVSFGEWLKRQRMGRGLTREQLAHQIGCAVITLRKIESEERRPSAQIVERLADIFNIPPSERTEFLHYARGDWSYAPKETETPWHVSSPASRTNLPASISSFIGREHELTEVMDLLGRNRLVTLTGAGGIGKTRLSLQVGRKLLGDFPNGVSLVELAPILDPVLVPRAIANIFGLSDDPQPAVIDMLCDYLHDKKMLIILDNCEHIIDVCGNLTEKLLHAAPHLHILATSREPLGISGEVNYRVPPLKLPDAGQLPPIESLIQYEAVSLFIERGKSAVPNFIATNETASVLTEICYRLDGIPLAIELAAAKLHMLNVEQIAKRLDDRFRLLTSGNRTVLERHQTLRAVMDWSYNLLSLSEQILLRRLSIFVGGWILEAAESVCAGELVGSEDILSLLEQLVNKSLVIVEEVKREIRYRMLETIRQYANEKLVEAGEIDSLRYRHLGYFLDLAEQAAREHYGHTRDKWRDRIERDDDNFRAALEWCLLEKSTKDALRLLSAWGPHGYHRFSEFHTWFDKIRALPNIMDFAALYAGLLNRAASSSWLHGNYYSARSLIEESHAIWLNLGADGELGLAEALVILGEITLKEKDIKGAQSLFEQSLEIYQKHGDKQRIAQIIFSFGHKALEEGSYVEAEEQFKKSLTIWRDLGDEFAVAGAYNELGLAAQMQGDYAGAGEYYEHCIKILRKRRSGALSISLFNSAWVFLHAGDDQHARLRYEESLKLCREQGDINGMILCLAGFACVLGIRHNLDDAARLFGAFESLLAGSKSQLDTSDRKEIDYYLSVVRTQLDGATWKKAWAEGCEMTLEQAIIYALEMG